MLGPVVCTPLKGNGPVDMVLGNRTRLNQNAEYGPAGKAAPEPDATVVLEDVTDSNSNVKLDIFPEIGSTNVPITETVVIELLPPILMLPPPTTVIPRAVGLLELH